MTTESHNSNDSPKPERLDEHEADFQTIIAYRRGAKVDSAAYEAAIERVAVAVDKAAACILPGQPDRAANGAMLWWRDMQKKGGGFDRYDGVRSFVPYAFTMLWWSCRGRENQRDQNGRRTTTRDPDDDRRNPDKKTHAKPGIDRRQVPLDSDPVDLRVVAAGSHRHRNIEAVRAVIDCLPDDKRNLLLLRYWYNAKPAEIAECLGVTVATVYMRLNCVKNSVREKLEELGYRRVFTSKGFSFTPP